MPLRICFVTAEMAPLAKAGGLADVSAALFKYLTAAGHDLRLFLPAYSSIDRKGIDIQPVELMRHMLVKIGAQDFPYSVLTASLPGRSTTCACRQRDCDPLEVHQIRSAARPVDYGKGFRGPE